MPPVTANVAIGGIQPDPGTGSWPLLTGDAAHTLAGQSAAQAKMITHVRGLFSTMLRSGFAQAVDDHCPN